MMNHVRLLCVILILLFANHAYGDTLEIIRQQFEIYERHSGEIEILSTDNIAEIDHVLKRTETKRLTARKALDNVQTISTTAKPIPLLAESEAAPFHHYVSVERAFAQRSLQQEKPDEAIQAIDYTYRLAEMLSVSDSLERRRTAALLRLQMLEIVQSFLMNPLCRHQHHELLHTLFEKQLNKRETDKANWTRYRDEGKRFFDEVTRGGVEKTVPPKLLNELLNRQAFNTYEKKPAERFAHDQTVFLQVMSAMIESCEVPYYRRQAVLRQLDKELRDRQGTASEPVFAVLLLRDVSGSMRLFAQERSGMEMAYLALAASLHGQSQRKTMNFLTGNEYEFRLIPGGMMCTYEGNIKPFYVPHR